MNQEIFNYFADELDVTLLETQWLDILHLVKKYNELSVLYENKPMKKLSKQTKSFKVQGHEVIFYLTPALEVRIFIFADKEDIDEHLHYFTTDTAAIDMFESYDQEDAEDLYKVYCT